MALRRDASFVIRIWWEECDQGFLWRGQVIHAPTGEVLYLDQLEEILSFIQQWSGIAPGGEQGQARPRQTEQTKEDSGER